MNAACKLLALILVALPSFAQLPDTIWTYQGAGAGEDALNDFVRGVDGGYVAVGSKLISANNYDVWALKLDDAGGVVWSRTYTRTGTHIGRRIAANRYGPGYVILASGFSSPNNQIEYLTIDTGGNIVRDSLVNSQYAGSIGDIVRAPDGGFFLPQSTMRPSFLRLLWTTAASCINWTVWAAASGPPMPTLPVLTNSMDVRRLRMAVWLPAVKRRATRG